jgi:SOS-response transcriptional repressor LexA
MVDAGISIGTSTLQRAREGQGGNRLQSLAKIARFFDVTTDQLLQPDLGLGESANVAPAPTHRRVPLISWVQAGTWQDVVDNFHPGQADEWALAFDSLPGKNAFALRVVGDSMTNPIQGRMSFPEGTIIIVDPGRAAGPGDYVIAKDVQTQQATFKQLATDGGRWYLRPLNPAYPTVEIDDPAVRVIGRVIEYQSRGKL